MDSDQLSPAATTELLGIVIPVLICMVITGFVIRARHRRNVRHLNSARLRTLPPRPKYPAWTAPPCEPPPIDDDEAPPPYTTVPEQEHIPRSANAV
jgi:hypothetical protein